MQSLNAISENMAYQLGDQFNATLRQSIKDTVVVYRSKFIRDSDIRNFDDMTVFAQNLSIPLIKVDLYEELGIGAAKQAISFITTNIPKEQTFMVLRSKEKVPSPYRNHIMHREPFKFIGSFEGSTMFHYTTLATLRYDAILPNRQNTIFYAYINGYIYIINNLRCKDITTSLSLKELFVTSIFDDPRLAFKACDDPSTFIDDRPFPISNDLLTAMYNMIKKGEFIPGYSKDGQAINLKPDRQDDK